MSDPRAYEQLLDAHLRGEGTASHERLVGLEARIAELTAELARRDGELSRRQAELAARRDEEDDRELGLQTAEARLRAAEVRLRVATSERTDALRELERKDLAAEKLKRKLKNRGTQLAEQEETVADRESEVKRLESAVTELRQAREEGEARNKRMAGEYRARVRELEQLVSVLAAGLAQTKEDIDRAAGSRAWRWGHGTTRALRKLTLRRNVTEGALARALQRIEQLERGAPLPAAPEPAAAAAPPRATAVDERSEGERGAARAALAAEIRDRLGPAPHLASWPAVSLVVPTRNGRDHLEQLVKGLRECTDYPELELVVVDNDSSDGSVEFLAGLDCPFPVTTILNEEPVSFSRANAQGVERARHRLILFLNNDIEPFERGWLRELVAAHEREG